MECRRKPEGVSDAKHHGCESAGGDAAQVVKISAETVQNDRRMRLRAGKDPSKRICGVPTACAGRTGV
jgi:hypothetical protein